MFSIHHVTQCDIPAREALLDEVMGDARFTKTAARLRDNRLPAEGLSFIARAKARVIGTVQLWHVAAGPRRPALLLGPLAVASDRRNRGIGTALMRRALVEARRRGHGILLLVGDAPYYGRFGFSSQKTRALWLPGPHERDRLLGRELTAGALDGARGLVHATGPLAPKPELSTLAAELFAGLLPAADPRRSDVSFAPRAA